MDLLLYLCVQSYLNVYVKHKYSAGYVSICWCVYNSCVGVLD